MPVASALELWHCVLRQKLMAQPANFAKCACQHCGGHIEFPIAGVGRNIACPHCGEKTLLSRAAPVEIGGGCATRSRIYWAFGIATCLVLAAGGAYLYVNYSNINRASVAPARSASPATPDQASNSAPFVGALPPAKPKPPSDPWHGLKAGKVTLDKAGAGNLIYAIGTLTNETPRQRFVVKVELEVMDGHRNKLGSATDYKDVIEPGKEWTFRALVTDRNAKSVRLTKVKEQE
jgi:hypothetical protein